MKFECLIRLSGTLAMKFRSERTTIVLRFTPPLLLCAGVSSTKELLGRERSLSTSLNAFESFQFFVVLHHELSYSEIKMLNYLYPSALTQLLINLPLALLPCALMFLMLFKIPRPLFYKGIIVPLIPLTVPVRLEKKFLWFILVDS